MINYSHKRSRGFSLLETVVILGFSAVVLWAFVLLLLTFNKSTSYERTVAETTGSASALIRELEAFVLPANAVVTSRTFSGTLYTTSASTLILELPTIDASGNIVPAAHDYVVFYRVGTTVYRRLEAYASSKRVSGLKKLSGTVSVLTFAYDDADLSKAKTVTVDARTQALVKDVVVSDHRQEQIRLRNI